MTRRQQFLILLVIALITGAAVVWKATPPKEPSYQGRLLSAWLYEYNLERGNSELPESRNSTAAAKALREIGTNALPCVVRWLAQSDNESKWVERMEFVVSKTGWVGLRKYYRREILQHQITDRKQAAFLMFHLLGTNTSPAIPALKKLAMHRTPSNVSGTALFGLFYAGSAGSDALQSVLKNQKSPNRIFIIKLLTAMPERYRSFTPKSLVQYLDDPEREVRDYASNTLARVAPVLLTNSAAK